MVIPDEAFFYQLSNSSELLTILFEYSHRTMGTAIFTRFDPLWLWSNIVVFSGPWHLQHCWRYPGFWGHHF